MPLLTNPPKTTEAAEKRRLLQKRWDSLAPELQTSRQLAGKTAVSCGATHHVMERCNFSCTCCYLGADANHTQPLPFSEVREQLDLIRRELGPRGKVQITAGEVTLLPLDDLGKIIRYALDIGLDPMVMTHGQRFLDEPDYLIALVREYGLLKISIHIDTTQRGRRGIKSTASEHDLHAVRDDFADLIRNVRTITRRNLVAASTVTVTDSNLAAVAEITRWFFRNADAFRLLSFLPVADVGRTRKAQGSVEREGLWEQIHAACGRPINRAPLQFGHRQCNNIVPLLLAAVGSQRVILEGVREGNERDALMLSRAIDFIGEEIDWGRPFRHNLLPFLRTTVRNPSFLLQTISYTLYRITSDRALVSDLWQLMLTEGALPRLHPFLFIIHNFMSPGELQTEEGKERLAGCTFKVPVDGEMISMCEMNALGIREKIDQLQLQRQSKKLLKK